MAHADGLKVETQDGREYLKSHNYHRNYLA